MNSGTTLQHHDLSDVGCRRANNQDSWCVHPPVSSQQYRQRGWLLMVADGMGAHAAGELASGIAVREVPTQYQRMAGRSPPVALRESIKRVNAEIYSRGEAEPEYHGMGTTCTALAILPRGAVVAHIGDSRCYRIRKHTIDQLTFDHSLVWELEHAHQLSRENAAAAPRNIITRSMGPHPDVKVDVEGPHPIEEDDVFLLCSDGLTGQVSDEEIGLVAGQLSPREAAELLVGLTLCRGAPDNVTVVVARAGPGEVSSVAPNEPPWQMSETPAEPQSSSGVPWKLLAVALGSFFASLVLFGLSDPWAKELVLSQRLLQIAGTACGFASVVALLMALLGKVGQAPRSIRILKPDGRLGKGPYRTYDCTPSPALVEGIAASLEEALDRVAPERQPSIRRSLDCGRRDAADGQFKEAIGALADGFANYRAALEQARRDADRERMVDLPPQIPPPADLPDGPAA
ncbi:MAG: PP2C family protein-serine/threonine phosphatase [Pirellulales bacterium]